MKIYHQHARFIEISPGRSEEIPKKKKYNYVMSYLHNGLKHKTLLKYVVVIKAGITFNTVAGS